MTDLVSDLPPADDGGHDAIKGFAYQFDKSLLEIFRSPGQRLEIEGAQDLSGEHYHMQIKNRSGKFYPSVIGKAVRKMFSQFMVSGSSSYILHCHFSDQVPGTVRTLSATELESLLGGEFAEIEEEVKAQFLKAFVVHFSDNYEDQFRVVLKGVAAELHAKGAVEAVAYHAILHAHLRSLVLSEPPGFRRVGINELKKAVKDARSAIFASTYADHCGYENYLKMVRRQYLPRRVDVPNVERIFSFECRQETDPHDIAEAVLTICERYRVRQDSPAPYFTFRGHFNESSIKASLWEAGAYFNDGRGYHGGEFRMEILTRPPFNTGHIKIFEYGQLQELMNQVRFKEFHDFFLVEGKEPPIPIPRPHQVFFQTYGDLARVFR